MFLLSYSADPKHWRGGHSREVAIAQEGWSKSRLATVFVCDPCAHGRAQIGRPIESFAARRLGLRIVDGDA